MADEQQNPAKEEEGAPSGSVTDVADKPVGTAVEDSPKAAESEASESEAAEIQASETEASEPEAAEIQASETEASEPEAAEIQASEPEASEIQASETEASEPEASEIQASEQEGTVQEHGSLEESSEDGTRDTEEIVTDVPPPPPTGMIGYTGAIIGDVIKLEDLEGGIEASEQELDLDELRDLVETTLTNVTEHEIVTGKVISVGEKDVVIDIGFKSDGIVSRGEFEEELTAGDEIEVYLERIEDYHGQLVLSKTKADTVRRWRRIEEAHVNEEVIEGTIVRRIKGGMIVELFDGMEAFLPGSQIDVRPVRDFDAYLDKRMEFKIVKLNPVNENIVVSHKALIEKDLQAQRQTILSTMEPGQILQGVVKNITDFGVFIDLGGVDGLLHITDLSWGRVSHPSELVSLDEELDIVVLDYDKERQRISLGLKQLQPHPWDEIESKFTTSSTVEGKVVSITDYGAFVELQKGIEGLVHISEMSWTEHIRHPSQIVSLGQLVQVKILNIDTEGKKISLGMKQLEPDPWQNIADRYPPGTVMNGKVRNITNFGVFVEIEPGIDGLVHISDLSWTKRIRHPSEMVKKGQELDVVVLNIDTDDRRISLGHKQVETNPWNQLAQVYAEGEKTHAKVIRIENKGLIVELPLDVEAFIPTGELRQGANLAEAYPVDMELEDLTIIRFAAGKKEIILSETVEGRTREREEKDNVRRERAAERRQEKQKLESHMHKEDSSAGPTTVGELSGLADLKARLEAQEAEAPAKKPADKKVQKSAEKNASEEPPVENGDAVDSDEVESKAKKTDGEKADVNSKPKKPKKATRKKKATTEKKEEPAAASNDVKEEKESDDAQAGDS